MDLTISIGILAHNESVSIKTTLQSLFKQNLFNKVDTHEAIEIVVVPNGCTDDTAEVSRTVLAELAKQCPHPNVQWRVCEVAEPGKSNAWNLYVHQFSDPGANYLFLMDADIQFLEPDTLGNMIHNLETKPDAWVSVDRPIKDVSLKQNKNLLERLSVRASESGDEDSPGICGQLYCGRAARLREIWMPPGLPVEDGFLLAMVNTDLFRSQEDCKRVKRAPNASHVFEAYVNILALLRHEKRLVVGSTINAFLYGYLWANCNKQQDAGSLIKRNNEQNPLWLRELIQQAIQEQGWWIIPQPFLFRRFEYLKYYSPLKAVLRLPFAFLAFIADLLVCIQANYEIHQRGGLGYWGQSERTNLKLADKNIQTDSYS